MKETTERVRRTCADCGADITHLRTDAKICHDCKYKRKLVKMRAYRAKMREAAKKSAATAAPAKRFCAICGADISDRHHRALLCFKCKRQRNIEATRERARKIREKTYGVRVCKICGKPLVGMKGNFRYCEYCNPYRQPSKLETPEEREARLAYKVAAEKKRSAKALEAIMRDAGKAVVCDAVVYRGTDSVTGDSFEWRGTRCGAGGRPCNA